MQVNLHTHGLAIKQAYESVLDAQNELNWLLLGYDKGSMDLKVISTGDGGLDELTEEFEGGKILYAFCRVIDPNSQLPKFVFISWCGDGVPAQRKALIVSHASDVKERLKGFHVEITARSETDVEPKAILKRVQDSSGAKFSYQQKDLKLRKDIKDTGPAEAVGTNYQRPQIVKASSGNDNSGSAPVGSVYEKATVNVGAAAEARKVAMHAFQQAQFSGSGSADKLRQERQQQMQSEFQQKQTANIPAPPAVSTPSSVAPFVQQQVPPPPASRPMPSIADAERLRQQQEEQAERLRQQQEERQRLEEADRLRLREEEAKRLREQQEEAKRLREQQEEEERSRHQEELQRQQQKAEAVQQPSVPSGNGALSARALYHYAPTESNEMELHEGDLISDVIQLDPGWWQGVIYSPQGAIIRSGLFPSNYVELIESQSVASAISAHVPEDSTLTTGGLSVRALYDYTASEDNEVSFQAGDVLHDVQQVTEDWWTGEAPSGQIGLFPATYVESM